jgi:hypothetical protein
MAIKAVEAICVTRFAPGEVMPRSPKITSKEIPALHNKTEVFVDLISYIIKSQPDPQSIARMWPLPSVQTQWKMVL